MSQAEELLNNLSGDDVATYIADPASEGHIVVGLDRKIIVPDVLKRIAVQYDHNIETVTFDCPRYWDGHDMSKMKVYINFIRADKQPGSYPIDNGVTVDDVDQSIMHFDWTISREVTEAQGNIIFMVCVKAVDNDGNETEHWNSELCKDMYISEGMEVLEHIVREYPDLITHLLNRMDIVENKTTLQSMLGYLDTYFTTDAKINEVLRNYVSEYLTSSDEVTQTIADTVNAYIEEYLSATDKTLTVAEMPADAKATGEAIKNTVDITNDTSVVGSVAGPLKLNKLFGKSVQEKTSGKNKLKTIKDYVKIQEVTLTADKDGVVTINGTSANAFATQLWDSITDFQAGQSYILSGIPKELSGGLIRLYTIHKDVDNNNIGGAQDIGAGAIGHIEDNCVKVDIWLWSQYGQTYNNVKIYPMLRDASITDDTWEPCTGGQASPNPEYPQPIVSAGQKLIGNQLFDVSAITTLGTEYGFANPRKGIALDITGTVTFSHKSNSKIVVYRVYNKNTKALETSAEVGSGFTKTVASHEVLIIHSDSSGDWSTIVDAMLNYGTTALPWEPYTGGVKKAWDTGINGKIVGAQLFDVDEVEIGTSWNDTKNPSRAHIDIDCEPNTTYTISCDTSGIDLIKVFQRVDSVTEDYITYFDDLGTVNHPFTTKETAKVITIQFNKNNITLDDIKNTKVMLNKGATALPWQPYTEQSFVFPLVNGLPGIPVTDATLANYTDANGQMWCCDEIDTERGVWVQRINRRRLSSADVWRTVSNATVGNWFYTLVITDFLPMYDSGNNEYPEIISTHFGMYGLKPTTWLNAENSMYSKIMAWYDNTNHTVALHSPQITTSDELYAFLDANEVYAYYPLATPIETPLTREQILAVRDLMAGEGGTNVFFDEVAPGIEMEYPRTLAAGYTLQNQKDLKLHNDPYRDVVMTDEEVITIDDAAAGGMKVVDMFGKSVQEKTSGNQLFDKSTRTEGKYKHSNNGNVYTNVEFFYSDFIEVLQGDYIISGSSTDTLHVCFYDTNKNYLSGVLALNFTAPQDGYVVFSAKISDVDNIMLNKGTTALPWEPYTNGPTPNPEYPQPIVSAGQKLLSGKNKIKVSETQAFTSSSTWKTIVIATHNLKANVTYCFSCDSNIGTNYKLWFRDSSNANFKDINKGTSFSLTEEELAKLTTLQFVIEGITSGTVYSGYIHAQVEEGTTATPYEPYTGGVKAAVDTGIEYKVVGKNKLKNDGVNQTSNGITFTIDDDKCIVLKGNSTAITFYNFGVIKLKKNETIAFTGCPTGGSDSSYRMDLRDANSNVIIGTEERGNGIYYTPNEDVTLYAFIRVASGYACNNLVFKPMIRIATIEDDTYEPYTEQNITLNRVLRAIPVTDASLATYTDADGQMWCADYIDLDKEIYVGNLLENTAVSKTIKGITFDVQSDRSVVVDGISTDWASLLIGKFTFEKGKIYRMSGCPSGGAITSYYLSYSAEPWYNDTGSDAIIEGTGAEVEIYITVRPNISVNKAVFKPMIRPVEIDGIPTSPAYVPYSYGKFTKKRGVLVEKVLCETLALTKHVSASESKSNVNVWNGYASQSMLSSMNGLGSMCSHISEYKHADTDDVHFFVNSGNPKALTFYLPKEVEEATVDILAFLATPIESALTDEEFMMLHQLKANHGINYIYGGGADVHPATRFRYGVTDVAGMSLENSNLNAVNDVLIAKNDLLIAKNSVLIDKNSALIDKNAELLDEINTALPFKIVIDDTAGTINFIDR